jgi:hypothetical protein
MASPSVESCPEPVAYSSDNSYANIDFTEPPMPVFTAQPKFEDIDKILSNQLGPVTNPVTTNAQPQLSGSPVLPFVSQNNAAPVVNSSVGADVTGSSTLVNNNPPLTNNSITAPVVSNALPVVSNALPVAAPSSQVKPRSESFANNLVNFIKSRGNVKNKEHFGNPKTIFNNIILLFIIVVAMFYLYSISPYYQPMNIDLSNVPLIGSLTDNNVSDNNKLMIVAGILIAVIVISRLLK